MSCHAKKSASYDNTKLCLNTIFRKVILFMPPPLPFYWRIFFNFHNFNISLMPYLGQIFKKGLSRRIRYVKNYIGIRILWLTRNFVVCRPPLGGQGWLYQKMLTLDLLYSGWCCSTLYKLDQVWRGECVRAGCLGSRQYCWRWS